MCLYFKKQEQEISGITPILYLIQILCSSIKDKHEISFAKQISPALTLARQADRNDDKT